MSTVLSTVIVETAKTLAVDGINASRVRTPDNTDNMGQKLREYALYFAIPGSERLDYVSGYEDGKAVFNAIRVEVSHSKHRKQLRATAKPVNISRNSVSESFGFGSDGPAEITLTAAVPAPRFNRRALDALAAQVFDQLDEHGFPREDVALADLWDSIVTAHGVAAPALV